MIEIEREKKQNVFVLFYKQMSHVNVRENIFEVCNENEDRFLPDDNR